MGTTSLSSKRHPTRRRQPDLDQHGRVVLPLTRMTGCPQITRGRGAVSSFLAVRLLEPDASVFPHIRLSTRPCRWVQETINLAAETRIFTVL